MRKFITAIAVGALAAGVIAAPGAIAKKGLKNESGSVSVAAKPSTIEAATATIEASGNVKSSSSCRKGRTVRFSYLDSNGAVALTETAVTKSNGDYKVTLPKPTTTGPATVTLVAEVDEAVRTKATGQTSLTVN